MYEHIFGTQPDIRDAPDAAALPAVRGTIEFTSPEGKQYRLNHHVATLRAADGTVRTLCEVGEEGVDHVAQARGGVAHAVRQVQPAALRLERRRAEPVLAFLDRVIKPRVNDPLALDRGVLDVGA